MGEGTSLLYRRCSNKTGRCWLYTGNLALTSEQVHTLDHVWMRMVNGYFKPYKRHTHTHTQEGSVGPFSGPLDVQVVHVCTM